MLQLFTYPEATGGHLDRGPRFESQTGRVAGKSAPTDSPAPTRLHYLITSLPHNSSLLDGRVKRRSRLQASGEAPCNQGPPASRAPHRAFHPDRKRLARVKQQQLQYRCLWKIIPFRRAFALQSFSRNCYPAPDHVPRKPIFLYVFFSRRAFLFTDTGTPNLLTKIIPPKICWLKLSGKFPTDMRIPPLKLKIMLESNLLTSRIFVRRLALSLEASMRSSPEECVCSQTPVS